ncbi:hypothetical protein SuNHUV7_41350 (plasmid) [Pseudoseohaeicola sp. NH-UV-7]
MEYLLSYIIAAVSPIKNFSRVSAAYNRIFRFADLGAKCSECPQSAPCVERNDRPIPDIQRCSMLTHQLAQTGHSSMAQHFREANDRSADKVPMRCATRTTGFKTH